MKVMAMPCIDYKSRHSSQVHLSYTNKIYISITIDICFQIKGPNATMLVWQSIIKKYTARGPVIIY